MHYFQHDLKESDVDAGKTFNVSGTEVLKVWAIDCPTKTRDFITREADLYDKGDILYNTAADPDSNHWTLEILLFPHSPPGASFSEIMREIKKPLAKPVDA